MKKIKKQNGITLVALVITVIILLILAGVALSIVFNGGIIDKSANAVDSYEYSSKNEDEKLNDLEARFTQLYNERVAGKEGGSGGTIGGGSGSGPTTAEWVIDTDHGDTGLSLGDLIKPKNLTGTNAYLANEKFYVIGKDDTEETVTLLAQYCVDWEGTKAQDPTMGIYNSSTWTTSGTLLFRTDYSAANANVYSASDIIKEYVDAYANKLTTAGLTLEDVETAEGGATVTGTKGRLMWGTDSSGEVQIILGSNLTNKNDIVYGPSGSKLRYWLGSPCEEYADLVWSVFGDDDEDEEYVSTCAVYNGDDCGLRPVIKVLASKISAT